MYIDIFMYLGDVPPDHLFHKVAFVFFTMALLGDQELRRICLGGKLHRPWTRRHTEEAADDRVETAEEIYWCVARCLRAMGTIDSATKADVRKT
jgi:hypothetical protein